MSPGPLTQAVTSGDASAVSAVLANGADVNERTGGGQTPLILATIFGHTHLIQLLLDAGADPALRDNLGLNAIDWAQRRGSNEATELFTQKKRSAKTAVEVAKPQPPPTPQPSEEIETGKSVSQEERSRRWIEGLKQRIAEESTRETDDGPSIFRAPTESVAAPSVTVPEPPSEPEPEPQIAQVEPTPAETPKEDPPPKTVRKICPKCGAIYNSHLVAYCAHHIVRLVDADAPIISEPQKPSTVLFWMLVIITLSGSIVLASVITTYLYRANKAPVQVAGSPPAANAVQKGIPTIDPDLEGKVVSLAIAECPLNGQEAIPGTVVVKVMVDKSGQVRSARASGGDWLLRKAATEAAMNTTFSPEKLRGRETEGTITYTFEP